MPTILRIGSYRFFFYAGDRDEPPHIHAERDDNKASCRAQNIVVTDDSITVDLTDGRTISAPLAWYPRLLHGKPEERNNWRLIGKGEGILRTVLI